MKKSNGRYTDTQIRDGLLELGIKEVERYEEGFAFTHWKAPAAAVDFYRKLHDGAEARTFYIGTSSYVLAE